MDFLTMLMNMVAVPTSLFTLLFFLPPYLFFKSFLYILRSIFPENVAGKVVLITGASSGIGEHLAYEYAKRGALLVLVARRKNSLRQVAYQAHRFGSPHVLVIQADVSKIDDCKRFVDEALDYFGRLDHLVTDAGLTSVTMFEEVTNVDDFRSVMETNFWGAIYPAYFAIPHLKKHRGKIVVITSAAKWLPVPRLGFYNASKAAVSIFFEALRVELGNDVRITNVTPGLTESKMTKGKFLTKEGKLRVDQELRDVEIGPSPVMYVRESAKNIVTSVCRGVRDVTVPFWFNTIFLWQILCPEVVEWGSRVLLVQNPGRPTNEALSKKILDATGAKYFLYPPSILSPEIKTD